jgi:hypothetical protein
MTQHTPGPWSVFNDGYGEDCDPPEPGKRWLSVSDSGENEIAVLINRVGEPTPTQEANAALIAAAPETAAERDRLRESNEVMLEALKAVVLAVANNPTGGPWEQVTAAIAAAEGRADLGATKHVHSFSTWHDRQDRPARGYSRCACGVEPGDAWAEAK